MGNHTLLIIGDHDAASDAHAALTDAIGHAAYAAAMVLNTRWIDSDQLLQRPGIVATASGVIVAPRPTRPSRELPEPALAALRVVRERDVPLLALGDAHDLVLIEVARNVLGMSQAGSAWFDADLADAVVRERPADLTPRSIHGRPTVDLDVREHPMLMPHLPPGRREEWGVPPWGINPDYAPALEEGGLSVVGTDAMTGEPFLYALEGRRWHVTAAFLPQLQSSARQPHPLFAGLIAAVVGPPPTDH